MATVEQDNYYHPGQVSKAATMVEGIIELEGGQAARSRGESSGKLLGLRHVFVAGALAVAALRGLPEGGSVTEGPHIPEAVALQPDATETHQRAAESLRGNELPEVASDALPNWTKNKMKVILPRILALKDTYQEVEAQTGVDWRIMAAIHYREASNRPDGSMMAGENIGYINPDTQKVEGSSLAENGVIAAKHLKRNAARVYGVDFRSHLDADDIGLASLAFNRGGMYIRAARHGHRMGPQNSPYVMNGMPGYVRMHWPELGHYDGTARSWGEPESVHGKRSDQLGIMAVVTALGYFDQPTDH